ncbi:hypothetical protein PoB_004086200 [Plakobranchus ocellatus]|uniref:Exonuclease domain-containing protein n=1 Tax=Plakobranchus ocellatus TaxID=259542 RepID=A0AAV4B5I5_9GAST|nr:hypothetical protein PoB_004086200 [Plakobranchus ocellatus]
MFIVLDFEMFPPQVPTEHYISAIFHNGIRWFGTLTSSEACEIIGRDNSLTFFSNIADNPSSTLSLYNNK